MSPSFCFRLGVDLELLLRLLGGRPSPRALSPFPFACSPPFTMDRGPSSSPPTSTTRSPSDLSPESDSCPDFRRSSVFRRLADMSSFGVDERIGLRAEIGDRGRWFKSLGPSRGSLLLAGLAEELCFSRSSMAWRPGFSSFTSPGAPGMPGSPRCAISCWMEVGGRPGWPARLSRPAALEVGGKPGMPGIPARLGWRPGGAPSIPPGPPAACCCMTAFNSAMVICLARSTATATCC